MFDKTDIDATKNMHAMKVKVGYPSAILIFECCFEFVFCFFFKTTLKAWNWQLSVMEKETSTSGSHPLYCDLEQAT